MSYKTLLVDTADGVARITLNRPEKLNALSQQLLEELHAALKAAATDEGVRCVLLTGTGRGFSSGADLTDAMAQLKPGEKVDLGAALRQTYNPIVTLIREMEKPVVAALNGTAAGAGLNIALACDVVIAARSARLIQAFIKIGLVPDAGGTWFIPSLIGKARATHWMMSGEPLSAETAADWGLIAEVVDDEALPAAADALAAKMAAQPTLALAGIKRLVDAGDTGTLAGQLALEAEIQTTMGYSADAMEGIASFIQKREPKFRGK